MDSNLQLLRRKYSADPSHGNALELAAALLRTGTLQHFQELALAGDAEAVALLRYMRSHLLGGNIFHEIEDCIEDPMFLNTGNEEDGRYRHKYVNLYCNRVPYASLLVNFVDEAISATTLLRHIYDDSFLPPPDPVEIDTSSVSRQIFPFAPLRGHESMVVAIYEAQACRYVLALEDAACFDFSTEAALPIIKRVGRRDIQMRQVTQEDITSDERGTFYKQIYYEDLPDFAKPNVEGVPTYVMASLVTRHSVRDIDGPAWQNFYEPIAKVYVGYLVNYLLTQPSGWAWGEGPTYTFTCQHTVAAAEDYRNSLNIEEGYIPIRIERRLQACPLAGLPQFLQTRPRRSICPECGSDVNIEVHESRQLEIHEEAPQDTPEPPIYLNQILDYLQRLYQGEAHGDINSVLGGQELAVYLSEGTYGPIVNK